jgi:hypothetical protein
MTAPDHHESLLALTDRVRELLAAIDAADGVITPEQEDELDRLGDSLQLRAEAYRAVCAELDAEADACDAIARPYFARAASKRARAGFLKHRLYAALELAGIERAVGPTGGATIKASPRKVELLVPPEDVPAEFIERAPRVLISKIGEELKAGRELAFAKLVRGRHLAWVK